MVTWLRKYIWLPVVIGFLMLGAWLSSAFRRRPASRLPTTNQDLQRRIEEVDVDLESNRTQLENMEPATSAQEVADRFNRRNQNE